MQTHKRFKKNAIYYDKTQHANFRVKPLFQATKQQMTGEKLDVGYLQICVWWSCFVTGVALVFSVWKNGCKALT